MVKIKTWLDSKVNIPNCGVCNKWLGTNNSLEDKSVSVNKGYEIIIGKCKHSFHGNCISNEKCPTCYDSWNPIDKINIGSSDWWIVEEFWKNYFI